MRKKLDEIEILKLAAREALLTICELKQIDPGKDIKIIKTYYLKDFFVENLNNLLTFFESNQYQVKGTDGEKLLSTLKSCLKHSPSVTSIRRELEKKLLNIQGCAVRSILSKFLASPEFTLYNISHSIELYSERQKLIKRKMRRDLRYTQEEEAIRKRQQEISKADSEATPDSLQPDYDVLFSGP